MFSESYDLNYSWQSCDLCVSRSELSYVLRQPCQEAKKGGRKKMGSTKLRAMNGKGRGEIIKTLGQDTSKNEA